MKNKSYKNWKAAILDEQFSIRDAIKNLNKTALQLCFITKNKKFIGTVTDGDIRRALIKGLTLNEKIKKIINRKPVYIFYSDLSKINYIKKIKKKFSSHLIPILNKKYEVVDILVDEKKYLNLKKNDCEMVIITGGKGKRLMPLTKNKPKALIKVFGKPILENIILKAKDEGISEFSLITNHFHKKIKNFFKDGKKYNVNINYFREISPLGTAGGLSLIKNKKNKKKYLIITNCDIVTNLNYLDLLEFHKKNKNKVTIASRFFKLNNPYGVIKINKKNQISEIQEKPIEKHLISAGVYIMNYENLKFLKQRQKIDMTDLINTLIQKKIKIGTCLIHENWLDIGSKNDLKKIRNSNEQRYFI